jgi:hypothetical protein
MCQMSFEHRLAFIAEGLPIILASAEGFWGASCQITDHPREAEVLEGFAKEEAAKILILMDAVRCRPPRPRRVENHINYKQVLRPWSASDLCASRRVVERGCYENAYRCRTAP